MLGWQLNPMFGAAAMSLSSFCVVSNALRLNLFKIYDTGRDKKIKSKNTGGSPEAINEEKGEKNMEKIMIIEGMMCPRCEAHVKKALEAIPEVSEATASHKDGQAVVKLNAEVDVAVLKSAVEAEEYVVKEVK